MILLQIPDRRRSADVVAIGLLGSELQVQDVSTTVLPVEAATSAARYVSDEQPAAKAGSVHTVTLPGSVPATVLIVGLGDGSARDLRVAAVAVGRCIGGLAESKRFCVAIDAPAAADSRALAEGLVLGGYQYSLASDAQDSLHTVDLVGNYDRDGLTAGDEAADAAGWARDLGNTPPNELNPARLGELADQQLTPAGCKVTVYAEDWLRAEGFGGILAVGGGSATGPRLIEVSYRARRRRGAAKPRHVVLVGKGITFDSGGLNLKPVDGMRMMHTDMCGGAAVLGAVQYAAMQKLPVDVTVLVPTAENAVSGTAMRPSDVIVQYGGRTTEIGNTDAEGRLILADALAYAVHRLKPDVLVDIATLTGAMKVALGMETAGYFANDDELAATLAEAAVDSGEPIWRMPLEHAYAKQLDSPVADARNDPGGPGAITAALFLQPFTGEVAWAHLDIAGPARAAADGAIFSRGATGFGTRLLARFLELVAETAA
ncbi:MAG: leucyl aminopeptidase family protein [Actinomycetota bacterium]|nr:leucyl aminopeptidase family protein [Actinomycetota bacterium]MDQ2957029.1 leucyl aminopeptidase family protein [Actinomycetota bacterium]